MGYDPGYPERKGESGSGSPVYVQTACAVFPIFRIIIRSRSTNLGSNARCSVRSARSFPQRRTIGITGKSVS